MRGSTLLLMGLAGCVPEANGPPDDTGDAPPGLADNLGVEETDGTPGCDNLLPDHCGYPFPSFAFVDAEGRIDLPPEALPESTLGGLFDPSPFLDLVGFGTAQPIAWRLEGATIPDGFGPFDPEPNLRPDAPVVVVDASTGERVPFWLEPDVRAPEAVPPVWLIRPSVPLPRGTTIVVGIRGLVDDAGAPVEAPAPFAALRDAEASTFVGVHARRARFADVVFPTLEAAGVPRDELQLAWAFPTATTESATSPMLAVRDAIFAALPDEGPTVALDTVLVCDGPGVPEGCPAGIRVIADGTVDVPSVLLPEDELGVRRIRVDEAGVPVVDGVERWPFRLQLPHRAFEGDGRVPVMQYGHGFLGSQREANNGWIRDMADTFGFAILATSMQGMHSPDATTWIAVLGQDGGRFPHLAEQAMQGVANQLVQQRMMSTSLPLLDEPAFERDEGELAWDPDTIWYYGNSQGGSVGTVVMATSLDVQRGVLGVPGSSYPLLLHRSTVFDDFDLVLRALYDDPDAISRFLVSLGTGWDRFDPLTFAPHLHGDPLPGTPDHEVLLHVAKEDQQVLNEASFLLGRAAGSVLMVPAVRSVWGLAEQAYPASPGSALVEVDFGIPDDPTPLTAADGDPENPDGSDTHGWLRAWGPAQEQMVHFLRTGELIDVCEGEPCVTDGRP